MQGFSIGEANNHVDGQLYSASGSMGAARGFTGQYTDPTSGLDYYVSRYYDPVAGVFLSADTKEGNAQGMNPYAYVAENPETLTDPSGQMYYCPQGCGGGGNNNNPGGSNNGGQPHAPGHGNCYGSPSQCQSNPPPTGPTTHKVNLPTGCSGLTPDQCAKGSQAQQNTENHDQMMIDIFQALTLLANAAIDIYRAIKDFGGWNFASALRWFADILGILGDVVHGVALVASIFHSSGLQTIADGASFVLNLVAGIYKAATSSWWGMAILITGYYSIKAAFSEEDIGLQIDEAVDSIGASLFGINGSKWDLVSDGGAILFDALQAGESYFQWQYDITSNQSVSQYCRANPTQCN
jgi:RHS repeat-associated protein